MPRFRSVLCLLLLVPVLAQAANKIEFTVSAGKHDRKNEPVCIPLQLPEDAKPSSLVDLRDGKDNIVAVGQLTPPSLATRSIAAEKGKKRYDLNFVLASLEAGKSLDLSAVLGDGDRTEKNAFAWHTDKEKAQTELRFADRPVLRYEHLPLDETTAQTRELTYKVFHQVYDPTGKFLVTKGAGGQFTHHRGLYYGFAKTSYGKNTVDIWHCPGPKDKAKEAHQAHTQIAESVTGPVVGRHRVGIDWNGIGKKTFAKELREVGAVNIRKGVILIDFVSLLTPTDDDVTLNGDPQHAGFHFRASNEVADKSKGQTIFIRPAGDGKPGTEVNWPGNKKHVDLPWLAMSFMLGGKRYTVCYLDQPTNPKEARFSERTYGRFGSYFVKTVTKEKPLLVRYRVWLQEGQMKGDEVAALSKAFVEPVTVKLK